MKKSLRCFILKVSLLRSNKEYQLINLSRTINKKTLTYLSIMINWASFTTELGSLCITKICRPSTLLTRVGTGSFIEIGAINFPENLV